MSQGTKNKYIVHGVIKGAFFIDASEQEICPFTIVAKEDLEETNMWQAIATFKHASDVWAMKQFPKGTIYDPYHCFAVVYGVEITTVIRNNA